ncbi:hypothetical protein [Streptomyces sp. NPDC001876]|uniref:hypothetical protein n=1 Tax=Streptomyces sp. NPDC001876 TaxID=3154402 RepID=UPI00332DFFB7
MKQITVRLDDSQALMLDALTETGASANVILRGALTRLHADWCAAESLRVAGYSGGLIRTRVDFAAESHRYVAMAPVPGRKES